MTDEPTETARTVPRYVFVLVVHDAPDAAGPICARLRSLFIVRDASSAFDALDALTARAYACVVCYLGGRVRAADIGSLVERTAEGQTHRLVFVAGEGASEEDFAYLQKAQRNWLAHPASPDEVLALVRAVSAG